MLRDDHDDEGDEEEFAEGVALDMERLLTFKVVGRYVACREMPAEVRFRGIDCHEKRCCLIDVR